MSAVLELTKKVAKHTDIALALGIVTVLLFLLLPVPAFLLDIMLAFSISTALVILVTTLLIPTPLDLSVFPSLLLITTIIRLSLNVASTKLILANGHLGDKAAGQVISAFGHFVMQGNVVIGAIIFLILTIVNFVVITKGSSRIAEVAARFSLDAMPGKQMAIDAELSSGMIDNQTAKARRKSLEEETTFYGSMDGANKFVRGDAIAGVIITFINIIGGIVIGILQRNLPIEVAVKTYSILTIGDGLTCQIPSVIISLSAGLLVTKASNSGSSDKALFAQLSKRPRALFLAASLSSAIALLPGLPFFPFFLMSGALGGLAYLVFSIAKEKVAAAAQKFTPIQPAEENITEVLKLDTIKVELGMGLLSLASPYINNSLPKKFKLLRKQTAAKLGFILPAIRLQDNTSINRNDYLIKIKEITAGQGTIFPEKYMVMSATGKDIQIKGINCKEPAFGLPAKWVDASDLNVAEKDYTVLDSTSVITTHLTQIIKENITDLLSYTDVQNLVEEASKTHKKLIQDLIPDVINISRLQKVLHKLLAEGISIKDLPTILESAGDASSKGQNVVLITEFVRGKLARQICAQNVNSKGKLPIIAISDSWENKLLENMYDSEEEKQIVLPPSELNAFLTKVQQYLNDNVVDGVMPSILVSSEIRPYVRNLITKIQPLVTVLGHKELHSKYPVEHLGTV